MRRLGRLARRLLGDSRYKVIATREMGVAIVPRICILSCLAIGVLSIYVLGIRLLGVCSSAENEQFPPGHSFFAGRGPSWRARTRNSDLV